MKSMYMIFAGCVFGMFCLLEMRGVAMDLNQTAPKPTIYSSRAAGGGGGGWFFYSGSSSGGYYSSK